MKLPGGPQTWEVPPPTMVKSPPFAPKYPSETTIIQINACRRSRLYISAMVTKVIRRILTDCVHFSNARSGTMAKRLAKDIQTTKASIRALTALIGSFLGSLDRTQAASVDRPIRSEEHTSELQSLMRRSYAVFCLKNK